MTSASDGRGAAGTTQALPSGIITRKSFMCTSSIPRVSICFLTCLHKIKLEISTRIRILCISAVCREESLNLIRQHSRTSNRQKNRVTITVIIFLKRRKVIRLLKRNTPGKTPLAVTPARGGKVTREWLNKYRGSQGLSRNDYSKGLFLRENNTFSFGHYDQKSVKI